MRPLTLPGTLGLLSLVLLGLLPDDAEARRRGHHRPHVRVEVVVPPPVVRPPAPGPGWVWVPAHPSLTGWVAGHWIQPGPAPRQGWVYVSGYWRAGVWISGFWRPPTRSGFVWVEARVLPDGAYAPGYWQPEGEAPEGMVWRPGYWDGARWVEGVWVPVETFTVYGDDGEVRFFAVGDGQVEELALPATEADAKEQAAQAVPFEELPAADRTFPVEEEAGTSLHHGAPE